MRTHILVLEVAVSHSPAKLMMSSPLGSMLR